MRLWKKAKALGVWDPEAIDLSRDRRDWLRLSGPKRHRVFELCALFQAGEQAVTLDLLPLIQVVTAEGRLDEAIYLTSFLWEEAKHVDLFQRFFDEVADEPADLTRFQHSSFRRIVADELPGALRRLAADPSPESQVRAAVTYHIVAEGILADTASQLLVRLLADDGILPGMREGIGLLHRDEARHIAFGVYFLKRLIIEHGNRAYRAFLQRMAELKPIVEDSTRQFMAIFQEDQTFGVTAEQLMGYSRQRFAGRVQHIVAARVQTLEELRCFETDEPPGDQAPAGP
jgi:ribonucleoside-diphosphate reductase beta chain